MFARAASGAVVGVEAVDVKVESNRGKGLPGMSLIGLARGAVRESLTRVRAAILSSGQPLPSYRLVANLLPAELPKDASGLDLALAAALLASSQNLDPTLLDERRFFGELSLGGDLEPVRGAVLLADLARRAGDRELILPAQNAAEAAVIPGVRVIGVRNLAEMFSHLAGTKSLAPAVANRRPGRRRAHTCISEVRGQDQAKRAVELAAAGGHNLLMVGPPGSGKTMLARCLPGILPELDADECIEVTRVFSAAGRLNGHDLLRERPFRAPHHTASEPALCGGGSIPRPGEITLAHRGVLFLDELPEFNRRALESLREPLEGGRIHIARAAWSLVFPAEVLLVAAMNPCPCGNHRGDFGNGRGFRGKPCLCSFDQVQRYRSRISGPLLDRIDLHVLVDAIAYRDLAKPTSGETSAQIRQRITAARRRQTQRLGAGRTNSTMVQRELRQHVTLNSACMALLETAIDNHGLSARAIDRIIKVARTAADLAGSAEITAAHLEEGFSFRLLDRALYNEKPEELRSA